MIDILKDEQKKIKRLLFEKQCEIKLTPNLSSKQLKTLKNEVEQLKKKYAYNERIIQENEIKKSK